MLRRLTLCASIIATTGCGAARVEQPAQLLPETENTVALCQGGWTQATERELAAELTRRGGRTISREEVTQRGADTFRFGEREGQEAVEAYNTYVTCVLGVMQERTRRGMNIAAAEQEGNDDNLPVLSQAADAITWELYEVGRTPSGEPVIQIPVPEQTRANEEIQLQIVLPAQQSQWSSRGMPQWSMGGGGCRTSWSRAELLGSGTSYTARLYIFSSEMNNAIGHRCAVTLRAVLTDDEWFSRTELRNSRRENFHWWEQEYNIVVPPR